MSASTASVHFPRGGGTEASLKSVRIIQEEYKHDIAIYTVANRDRARFYRTGTPVTVSWGTLRQQTSMHGYVHHVEPSSNPKSDEMQVWCRGASSVFDTGMQMTYRFRTVPSVIAEIARQSNFDVDVEEHGQVFEDVMMNGQTWAEMVRNAKEIGYSLSCTNTRLQLRRRTALVERGASAAPLLTSGADLYEFSPIDGAALPGQSRALRAVSGINKYTGARFQVTGGVAQPKLGAKTYAPVGKRFEDIGSSTPEEARWRVSSLAEMDRYNLVAKAVAEGNTAVTQTSPVILSKTAPDYAGLWFVRKVEHVIEGGSYTMELDLGKDSLGSNVAIPAPTAKRVLVTRNNPQGRPKVVYAPTVLVGTAWQAQWSAASRTFRGA